MSTKRQQMTGAGVATAWIVAAGIVLSLPAGARADYTFGDWASDHGYGAGDAMPTVVDADHSNPAISGLGGIGDYNWTATPTRELHLERNQISSIQSGDFSSLANLEYLSVRANQVSSLESGSFSGLANLEYLSFHSNQISSIESGDFNGLTNLAYLNLYHNQISSIEAGDFSGLTNLTELDLGDNNTSSIESGDFSGLTNLTKLDLRLNEISSIESGAFSGMTDLDDLDLSKNTPITELNLGGADFSSLAGFSVKGNTNITTVSLRNSVLNQTALTALLDGGDAWSDGIGEILGITELDLSGVDFVDITNLAPLYAMDDLEFR